MDSKILLLLLFLSTSNAEYVDLETIKCTMGEPFWCTLYVTNVSAYGEIFRPETVNETVIKTVWVECLTETPTLTGDICNIFPNLEELWIQNCGVETVEPDAFKGCRNLFGLSLKGNLIKELEPNVFDYNVNLGHLYLSGNQLSDLPENIFGKLTKLERLNLDNNNFTELDFTKFTGLSELRYLEIYSNPLQDLNETEIFNVFKNLSQIWIGGTEIECDRLSELVNAFNGTEILRLAPQVDETMVDCLNEDQWEQLANYTRVKTENETVVLVSMWYSVDRLQLNVIWIIFELVFGIIFLISYFCFLISKCL